MSKNIPTIVTAFYDIGRENWGAKPGIPGWMSKTVDHYWQAFEYLCELDNPIILFTEEKFKHRVQALKKSNITVFYQDAFEGNSELLEQIARVQNSPEYQKNIKMPYCPEYWDPKYVLVNFLKSHFVCKAIELCPDVDNTVAWIDFGYCGVNSNIVPSIKKWRYEFSDAIHFFQMEPLQDVIDIKEIINSNTVYFQGCHIVAPKPKWFLLKSLMDESLHELLMCNLVDDDQTLMLMSYLKSSKNFQIHPVDITTDIGWRVIFRDFNTATNMKENNLNDLLLAYIDQPTDPENNWNLALYYDGIGQCAAAISYYIRAAERSKTKLFQYECLLRAGMNFNRQGTRGLSVRTMMQHAISLMPKRPEGYYLLSKYYEKANEPESWFYCYTFSSVGLEVAEFENLEPLRTTVDFPGKYGVLFEKAVSSWWCGLCSESRDLLRDLISNYDLDDAHRSAVIWNLQRFNEFSQATKFVSYDRSKFERLKYRFPGSETIEKNYSEAYQDMFVLSMLNGKKKGTYLEIGAGGAYYGNNTALLEKQFEWTGVSLDISEQFVAEHTKERSNPCLLKDATTINYETFLKGLNLPENIDYLQLDCDPPDITYKILLSIPFETRRFAVITYEHDFYCDSTKSYREKSRKYLEAYGYRLVAGNIAPDQWRNYEDWWVHPDLVDAEILAKFIAADDRTKFAEDYILNKHA